MVGIVERRQAKSYKDRAKLAGPVRHRISRVRLIDRMSGSNQDHNGNLGDLALYIMYISLYDSTNMQFVYV